MIIVFFKTDFRVSLFFLSLYISYQWPLKKAEKFFRQNYVCFPLWVYLLDLSWNNASRLAFLPDFHCVRWSLYSLSMVNDRWSKRSYWYYVPGNSASHSCFPKLSAKCTRRLKSRVLCFLMYYLCVRIIIANIYWAFTMC